jgi:hypothetical protein
MILKYFKYDHLPAHLKVTSKKFSDLAHNLVETLPQNQETVAEVSTALRKLLEAKDAAVRAQLG